MTPGILTRLLMIINFIKTDFIRRHHSIAKLLWKGLYATIIIGIETVVIIRNMKIKKY